MLKCWAGGMAGLQENSWCFPRSPVRVGFWMELDVGSIPGAKCWGLELMLWDGKPSLGCWERLNLGPLCQFCSLESG